MINRVENLLIFLAIVVGSLFLTVRHDLLSEIGLLRLSHPTGQARMRTREKGNENSISREAVIRIGIGQDLLNGLTQGRQGLIGSLRWSPLPTLLMLPLIRSTTMAGTGLAANIVAAVASALLCIFLNHWWAECGVKWFIRWPSLLLYQASPIALKPIISGMSTPLFALFMVCSFCFFIHWLYTTELRSLAAFSIITSLAVITRYQTIYYALGILVLISIYLLIEEREKYFSTGTLIAYITPTCYVIFLWISANWLIMGDPLFFLRGILPPALSKVTWTETFWEGCEWGACLLPGALAIFPWMLYGATMLRKLRWLSNAALLSACALVFVITAQQAPTQSDYDRELDDVLDYVASEIKGTTIVSGYRGYEIRYRRPKLYEPKFVHSLSLYMEVILKDYTKQNLYILVPRPVGADRWEDINLKYPYIFEKGTDYTLLEKKWSNWQLWRVVRIDEGRPNS